MHDQDVIATAFDPFFTTKPIGQGTGLGLSIIHGSAKQSGEQVRSYSEVGQGTMVCTYLPRHLGEAKMAEIESQLGDAPKAGQGETVLVIDDEPTVRMLVTEVPEDLGYTAIEAADGAAGLRVLQSKVRWICWSPMWDRARRNEWTPGGRRRPGITAPAEGAVHHRLRRKRGDAL